MLPHPLRSRLFFASLVLAFSLPLAAQPAPLPGTDPLTLEGDVASLLVEGIDKFLLRKIAESGNRRSQSWPARSSDPFQYQESLGARRAQLAHLLGVRDPRSSNSIPQTVATLDRPSLLARNNRYEIHAIRWDAFADVQGEGLLLTPAGQPPIATVIAIPDASHSPEQLAGLIPGILPESQFARRLAESGCRVVIPVVIDRNRGPHLGRSRLTAREFLHRSAFELGRTVTGYEIQKILALIDWHASTATNQSPALPVGVFGWGEGGRIALFAGALDPRIQAVAVSGHFNDRSRIWEEPLDRTVFGLLEHFGDAELAAMVAPRSLVIEAAQGPELTLTGDGGGAPSRLTSPEIGVVEAEFARLRHLIQPLQPQPRFTLTRSNAGQGPFATAETLQSFLHQLHPDATLATGSTPLDVAGPLPNPVDRQLRQFHQIDRHNQHLLTISPEVRRSFMSRLDTSSVEAHARTVEPYRQQFAEEIIGRFNDPLLPPSPRSRRSHEGERWTGYEVVLDVFPDVIAYGILLVPKDLKPGERRPVVVCQHGLEGRPQNLIEGDHDAYHDYAARLADRGFITFSPQNAYIFEDRFRTLQRKSYPLRKTLFSTIVPQHQQIVAWLQDLPFVDPARIGFYGLSYGGKSAMRIPPLVPGYVLSICSADFNEWVGKNAATAGTQGRYSYVWTSEYEIFEFDLGSTFNYAEMAALIAPRPFMVERGHFDGVAPDETVAWEFAKVRFLYAARLGIGNRCEMETFVGPHTINGRGTFDFLHRHLNWPVPKP
jgi:dienelactone hydrolase